MKTVLITGGNGNLGRLVADQLLPMDITVIKFDLPGPKPEQQRTGEHFEFGDMRDSNLLEQIIRNYQPDTILHLASLLSGSSEVDLNTAWEINATASIQLMQIALQHNVEKFFFASTIATYGVVDEEPMSEDYPQWPQNFYGVTKVAVERAGVYFKMTKGLDFRCLRFPLVVSPFAPKTAVTAFPSHAFNAALQGQPFTFPVSADKGISTIFLHDVIDSIVTINSVDRRKIKQHCYNLHAYYLSAGMVAEELSRHFPSAQFNFSPQETVEALFSNWPDVTVDQYAREEWGWHPKFDFTASAIEMLRLLQQD